MIQHEEEKFRLLADTIPQLAWVTEPDGRLAWFSQQWYDYMGTTAAQGEGWVWETCQDPTVLPAVLERWRGCLATGDPFELISPLRGADGTCRTFLTRVNPLKDTKGQVRRWFGTQTDLTERRRAEEAHAHLAAIVASSHDAIMGKDLAGVITSWNPAAERLLGFPAAVAIGQSLAAIIPADRRSEAAEILQKTRCGVLVDHLETVRRRQDGSLVDVSLTVCPVRDASGRIIGGSETARDITEGKEAREALQRSSLAMEAMSRRLLSAQEDERRRVARELHDEIGQALTALKINLQRIDARDQDAAARLEESNGIVARALQQVRGMALDLRPSILDDLGLMAALGWYVDRQAQRTGMHGRFIADPGEIRVHPEIATACFRVVQEALTNVARHARASRFDVELVQHSEGLELVIHDDGTGFDPVAALRAAARGASSGLTGMQERVELVGGQIGFVSERTEGTIVQVRLPNTPPH